MKGDAASAARPTAAPESSADARGAGRVAEADGLRVVVFGRRQLCGDCLHHLFERQLARCEVRVVSRAEEVRGAFGESRAPHVVVLSAICPFSLDPASLGELCARLAPLPLIVHVDAVDGSFIRQLMASGARAVLPTWLPPALTGAVLQLVAAGETYMPPLDGAPGMGRENASSTYAALSRLTPRQIAVLRLATEGKSNKEIGRALGLGPNTIKFHVATLMDKLGVDNRVRLAVVASRLLPP